MALILQILQPVAGAIGRLELRWRTVETAIGDRHAQPRHARGQFLGQRVPGQRFGQGIFQNQQRTQLLTAIKFQGRRAAPAHGMLDRGSDIEPVATFVALKVTNGVGQFTERGVGQPGRGLATNCAQGEVARAIGVIDRRFIFWDFVGAPEVESIEQRGKKKESGDAGIALPERKGFQWDIINPGYIGHVSVEPFARLRCWERSGCGYYFSHLGGGWRRFNRRWRRWPEEHVGNNAQPHDQQGKPGGPKIEVHLGWGQTRRHNAFGQGREDWSGLSQRRMVGGQLAQIGQQLVQIQCGNVSVNRQLSGEKVVEAPLQ